MVIQLMTMANSVLKSLCVSVLKEFLVDTDVPGVQFPLSSRTLGQLLTAMWEIKPSATDHVLLVPWLTAMKNGILTLHSLDEDLSLQHMDTFLPFVSSCWATDSKQVGLTSLISTHLVIRKNAVQNI
jgi:aromatic ring-cleaving dioxygenase